MNRRTSVLAGTLAGVLGGAIVGGSVLVGATAQSSLSADPAPGTAAMRQCGALLKKIPADLKQDLTAAWQTPAGEERRAALKKVGEDARAGEYGEQVQRLAEQRLERRGEVWERLPADLRSDIKDLRGMSPEERKAATDDIRSSALAGDYGEKIQQFAQHRQDRREECRPGTTS